MPFVTFSITACNIIYSLFLPDLITYLYIISSLSRYVIFVTMYLYVYSCYISCLCTCFFCYLSLFLRVSVLNRKTDFISSLNKDIFIVIIIIIIHKYFLYNVTVNRNNVYIMWDIEVCPSCFSLNRSPPLGMKPLQVKALNQYHASNVHNHTALQINIITSMNIEEKTSIFAWL